jgi:cell division protein ZapA
MNNETIPITLWLAGRDYRIRINPKDEEAIRMAAKIATERLQELRQGYQGKDDQDFLAMCLIMYATEQVTGDKTLDPVYLTGIKEMEALVDKALEE